MTNGSVRSTILAAHDLQEKTVEVAEWGVSVLLRGLTGRQRARVVDLIQSKAGLSAYYGALIQMAVRDPDTKECIFSEADQESIAEKSGVVLDRLGAMIMRLSGIGEIPKEMEKNSEGASDDSTSSSPPTSILQ